METYRTDHFEMDTLFASKCERCDNITLHIGALFDGIVSTCTTIPSGQFVCGGPMEEIALNANGAPKLASILQHIVDDLNEVGK